MGGILHTIRSATISRLYSILFSSPTSSNVKIYVDGNYMINQTGLSLEANKPNNLTQFRFGSNGSWVKSSVSYTGWDGQISELRVSDNVRYVANFTAPTSALAQDANTIGLYKASSSTTWNEVVNNVSTTPSGVFNINSVDTKNGLSYSLDIRNRGNTSPGLVMTGPSTFKDWPVTIEYWARASSAAVTMIPLIFTNTDRSDPKGIFFAVSPSVNNNNVVFLQSSDAAAQPNNPLYVFANTWHHYAITIEP